MRNNPKHKYKFIEAYISIVGLCLSIVIILPFPDFLEISVIISFILAIILFIILLNKPVHIKLIVLVTISNIGFGMIHGLTRLISTSIAGLFFAILFINRTKLEYWHGMVSKQLKLNLLIFGYMTVFSIHFYINLIGRLLYNTLDIYWINFLIFIGVVLLVYITQFMSSKIEERWIT